MSNGGPAFPQIESEGSVDQYGVACTRIVIAVEGMSLRDWFAAQALPAVLTLHVQTGLSGEQLSIAQECYELADAMLEAREDRS